MCDSDPTNVEEEINAEASRLETAIEAEVRRIEAEKEYIRREARRRADAAFSHTPDLVTSEKPKMWRQFIETIRTEAGCKISEAIHEAHRRRRVRDPSCPAIFFTK